MIDTIAQAMRKLEKIVTDSYSDSNKSEQLKNRKNKRLKALKNKENKSDKVIISKNNKEFNKIGEQNMNIIGKKMEVQFKIIINPYG